MKTSLLIAACLGLAAVPAWAQPGPATPAAAVVELQGTQVQALGIVVQPAADAAGATQAVHPARVLVPPAQQRVVSVPYAGLLQQLHVAAGEQVRAGQALAVVSSVQAQELQRELLQARSQAELTRRAAERDERLLAEGLIAASRLDSSHAAHQQAQALSAERQRLTGQSGLRSEAGALVLSSPISGTVLDVGATPGQRLEPATALLRVANLSTLWLEAQVPVAQADGLRVGDILRVLGHTDAQGQGQGQGRIVQIGRVVDAGTQTVAVRAVVSGAAAQALRPGQLLSVQALRTGAPAAAATDPAAAAGRPARGVVLPTAALVRHADAPAVFVEQAPGRYLLKPVQLLSASGSQAAVQGVAAGARVVVQGTAALLALGKP